MQQSLHSVKCASLALSACPVHCCKQVLETLRSLGSPVTAPEAQVWAALSLITEIRHRAVLVRLLHLGGTLASCQRAALAHSRAALARLQLTPQQRRSADDAEARLRALEL